MPTEQKLHIAYDDAGSGDPVVVLLHGLFANRTYYAAQVAHLSRRHRVLNLDLRGHGESDIPETGYTLDILADDVVGVCEQAGVTRAVFCGHSMAVALKAALRRPELTAGVALLDGAVLMPPEARAELDKLVQVLQTAGWREALLGFFPSVAGPAAERVRADISAVPRYYAEPIMRCIASSDGAEELAALSCPLMYVHSQIPTDLARLREIQPDAIIEEIPGAGHYQMLTAPDRINTLLDRFLEAVGRIPSGQGTRTGLAMRCDDQGHDHQDRSNREYQDYGEDAQEDPVLACLPLPVLQRDPGPGRMIARGRIVQIDPAASSSRAPEINHSVPPPQLEAASMRCSWRA